MQENVSDVFERMELFQLTRSSHAEAMLCVRYSFKLGSFELPQYSKTGGTSTTLVQKRTQKETGKVLSMNTVIFTLLRCLKRDEKEKRLTNHA
jgi:hypothetical protein